MFRAVGRAADVVLENKIFGMCRVPVREPVGEQRGFAAAGITEQDERSAITCGVTIKRLEIIRSARCKCGGGFRRRLRGRAPRG